MPRRPRIVTASLAAIALVVVTSLTACVPQASVPFVAATKTDAQWGQAPKLDPGVTLQPDVVIIGGGASSIDQVTSDGLTWVLKKNAPGVDQLKVGKVMFVTGDGVGRVIDLRTVGDQTAVTISPVAFTDVVRDGTFSPSQPVSIGTNAVSIGNPSIYNDTALLDTYGQEDAFTDPEDPTSGIVGGSGQGRRWAPNDITPPIPNVPIPSPALPKLPGGVQRAISTGGEVAQKLQQQDGNFVVTRSLKATDEETGFTYNDDGVEIVGSLTLTTTRPTADFTLTVSGGHITLAEFKLTGAGALHASIEAATKPGGQVVKTSKWIGEAYGFSIPVGLILGVPFSVFIGNQFRIQVRMPGDSDIKIGGDYSLDAAMGVHYENGKFTNLSGAHFDPQTSAQKSKSISVGISGLTIWDNVNFRVGIGWFGFSAGVNFSLEFRVDVNEGAPFGFNISSDASNPIEQCTKVDGFFGVDYGVGISMPKPILKVINWFLSVFHSPPIKDPVLEIGHHDFDPVHSTIPKTALCQ